MDTLAKIKEHRLIAILRGAKPDDVIRIAEALQQGGIFLLEVTMNSAGALNVIKELSEKFGSKMIIGAGTVLDAKTAEKAVEAGARFILSPTLNKKTIRKTKQLGAVSIPGAYTPTEILKAFEWGGDIIKVFPAGSGGASYIKDVMGPLSHIPMLPTGGITLDNIKDFQKIGVAGFGIGSSLVDTKKNVTEEYLMNLTETARRFVELVKIANRNTQYSINEDKKL